MKFHLDSSAWLKRYLGEVGSPEMDLLFRRAIDGAHTLVSSFWNVGECLGVLVKRKKKGELKEEEFRIVLRNFISETVDLVEGGSLMLVPVSTKRNNLVRCSDRWQADSCREFPL